MEASSVRKIYVDSRRKTPSSNSSSDFEFELNRAITLPRKCVAFVTDIHLTHAWTNVDVHNCMLFYIEIFGGTSNRLRRLQLPARNYTGTSLAARRCSTSMHATPFSTISTLRACMGPASSPRT